MVNKSGVHVDPAKIKAIQEWPVPKNVGDIRSFHGLASFIKDFFLTSPPLLHPSMSLLRKTYLLSRVKDNKRLL